VLGFVAVGVAAFAVSGLTLFSGFGLGTLLLPVFACFFPAPVAVASTALVHVANNLFKAGLLLRGARGDVVLRFGLPALGAAFAGAALLGTLATRSPLATWHFLGREAVVAPVSLVLGCLILGFGVLELLPALDRLRLPARWLPVGGLLSGFFGGLSGHQGALRAIFLSPLGLSPTEFVATQAALACLVDAARLLVYGSLLPGGGLGEVSYSLVGVAIASAFAGVVVGRQVLPRVTVRAVRGVTGALLVVVGLALATGVV
jgi:hypothetical protein